MEDTKKLAYLKTPKRPRFATMLAIRNARFRPGEPLRSIASAQK